MQIKGVALSLALAAVAAAQSGNIAFTSVPTEVEPGQAVTVTYEGNPNEPATIILRKGDPGNLQTVETITTTATGGSFQWTPPSDGGEDYALEIRQGSSSNFSGQIAVAGESNPGAAVTAAVASAASSAVSSVASSVSQSASSAAESATSALLSSASAVTASASSAVSSILASVSSAVNSTIPTTTMMTSMGTGTAMTRNTTMSSATLTSTTTEEETDTATATEAESTSGGTSAPNSNSAAGLSSPLALVLGAVAAMIYLN